MSSQRRPTVRRRAALAVSLGLAVPLLLAGCFGLRPTPAPVSTLPLVESAESDCLLILLPGRGDRPQRYAEHGFAEIARQAGVRADIVSPDLHMGYYREKSVHLRLRDDLVGPAREAGREVWLGGISLGGLGSLLYMARVPGDIEGALLLSPFLGAESVVEEIEAAGGLMAWEPPEIDPDATEPPEGEALWRRLWAFLQQTVSNPDAPPLYLAYGTDDRLARSHDLLARALPPERVFTVEGGGHDWEAWEPLWQELVEAAPVCR